MVTQREHNLADVAAMIGHPTRAVMLSTLMGGQQLPAGVFARCALAGRHVAEALEALMRIAPGRPTRRPSAAFPDTPLRYARTCYDHLAGTLGVLLADTLLDRGFLTAGGFAVTDPGEQWLVGLGIEVADLRRKRRHFVRPCLDWSERRDHLAGAVGAAIATTFLERRWVVRVDESRAVRLTLRGREGLYRSLGLELPNPRNASLEPVTPRS